MCVECLWKNTDRQTQSTCVKTCPNVTLSTVNSIWTGPISKSILRGESPAIPNYMCNSYLCVLPLEYGSIINNLIQLANKCTNSWNIICVLYLCFVGFSQ